jgi:hypothetical protein
MILALLSHHILFALAAILPGIYFASKKNLFSTPNPKYNNFIFRFLYSAPLFFLINVLFSSITTYIIPRKFPMFEILLRPFGHNSAFLIPLLFSLIIILCFKLYFLKLDADSKKDKKPQKEYDLYRYTPSNVFPNNTHYKILNTNRGKNELPIPSPQGNVVVDTDYYMNDKNIGISYYGGEIVVTEKCLEIFKEENLSGYYTRPAKTTVGFRPTSMAKNTSKYAQLVCSRPMPKLSPLTKIKVFKKPFSILVPDNKFYYDQKILSNVSDINQTNEYFGSEISIIYTTLAMFSFTKPSGHPVQRYWIVTKKARDVLMNRLKQEKWDFTPVYLVDDNGNVIDS